MSRNWVFHVDLDQFLAAVEILREPSLRGKPVVVGGRGDPTERAVVATASYEAREYGVRSGIPLRTAKKRCPDAVFLPTDFDAYNAASDEVMAVLRSFEVPVEVLGWDEAYLAVETDDPEEFAGRIQERVLVETKLHCSIGIGDNRLRAKVATDYGKPAGIFRLTVENWQQIMNGKPTDAVHGIGSKTRRKLEELGIRTVAELAMADRTMLAERFGPTMGPWIRFLAQGRGETTVNPTGHVARSRSRETTFQTNLADMAVIGTELAKLSNRVAEDVKAEGRPAERVAVKVRFAPFDTHTHSKTLPEPTDEAEVIAKAAEEVLQRFDWHKPDGSVRPIRLLGVRAEFDRNHRR